MDVRFHRGGPEERANNPAAVRSAMRRHRSVRGWMAVGMCAVVLACGSGRGSAEEGNQDRLPDLNELRTLLERIPELRQEVRGLVAEMTEFLDDSIAVLVLDDTLETKLGALRDTIDRVLLPTPAERIANNLRLVVQDENRLPDQATVVVPDRIPELVLRLRYPDPKGRAEALVRLTDEALANLPASVSLTIPTELPARIRLKASPMLATRAVAYATELSSTLDELTNTINLSFSDEQRSVFTDLGPKLQKATGTSDLDLVATLTSQLEGAISDLAPGQRLTDPNATKLVAALTTRLQPAPRLHIVFASAGDLRTDPYNRHRTCDATSAFRAVCERQTTCKSSNVGNSMTAICGYDPAQFAPDEMKGVYVVYRCEDLHSTDWVRLVTRSPTHAELRDGSKARLRGQASIFCEPPATDD